MASTMPPQAQALTPRAERKVREEDDWDPLIGLLELMYGWLLPCMCIGPYGGATARRRPLNVQRGRGGANEGMNAASTSQPSDPEEQEKGRHMAKAVAKAHFKDLRFTKIISSPFLRCMQTADLVKEQLELDVQFVLDNGLSEVFNSQKCYVDSEPSLLSAAEVEKEIPGTVDWSATRWGHREKLPKWGEKEKDAYARFKSAVRRLSNMRDTKGDQVILLCTHGDAIAAFYEALDPGACVYEVAFCSFVACSHNGDGQWKIEKLHGVGITT